LPGVWRRVVVTTLHHRTVVALHASSLAAKNFCFKSDYSLNLILK
jgi:hypothetical protein